MLCLHNVDKEWNKLKCIFEFVFKRALITLKTFELHLQWRTMEIIDMVIFLEPEKCIIIILKYPSDVIL